MINKKHNISEAKRVERELTYNPFDLFFKKKVMPSQFVAVGYLKDADDEKNIPKVTGMKKNIIENDEQFRDFVLNQYADTMWAKDFATILDTPDYLKVLNGKGKQARFIIAGHVVRIQRMMYNWRDLSHLAAKYAEQEDEIMQARANAGFGQGVNSYDPDVNDEYFDDTDDSYAEDDWRRNSDYMGTGVRQRGLKGNNKDGSGYRLPAGPVDGMYLYSGKDKDKEGMLALRNMLDKRMSTKSGYKSVYYYVAPNGEMEKMPYEFISFMRNNYKGTRNVTAKPVPEMQPDEKEYNDVINAIKAKYDAIQQPTDLIFDKILYITAKCMDWNAKSYDKNKATPMVFVNNRAIYQTFPFLKARFLNPVISDFCTALKTKDEDTGKYRYQDRIEIVTEKKKLSKKHQALYENIMRTVSKIVKRELNMH